MDIIIGSTITILTMVEAYNNGEHSRNFMAVVEAIMVTLGVISHVTTHRLLHVVPAAPGAKVKSHACTVSETTRQNSGNLTAVVEAIMVTLGVIDHVTTHLLLHVVPAAPGAKVKSDACVVSETQLLALLQAVDIHPGKNK